MTSTGTLSRPNTTYALQVMRDDDFSDPWGTAMSWAGSIADVVWDFDPNDVPAALDYSPGMGGPEVPGEDAHLAGMPYATLETWTWLYGVDIADLEAGTVDFEEVQERNWWGDSDFRERFAELVWTLKVLDRYLDWCRLAGRDY